ncbi:MAG: lipid A biosynthesis acyltransferase [Bacteroidetes bacterium]|nr:lipid A biosynthesis acyltransferase [Bacteroidota bacterium]MBX7130106.1 lipid A biosynthesis acyltransferase [Flavobacteriales bacterium]HNI04798.1 lipid A biosynthesis acyltransferase [Flavobacteriales bacterium]HNK67371.1 lipid A biosynthesis acyltransferase [Flavobacteriales bacterium]HNM68272.1 lipid A biosynthesis acyltransferase [Flavobacteriales bacterium]
MAASWTGQSKGTPLGYRIFILVMRTLGVRAAHGMLYLVVPWYVLTGRTSNRALRGYFRRLRATDPRIKGLSLAGSYRAFGRTIIDKVALRAGLEDRYTWAKTGRQHLVAMLEAGQGGVLISAHLGNWELASHMLHDSPGKISVVLQDGEDSHIREAIEGSTSSARFGTIALGNGIEHLFRISDALREGQVLCMHGDRNMPGARTRKALFLGEEAVFPAGPFALAAAQRVPVCIAFVVGTGPMTYTFTCTERIPAGSGADVIFNRYVSELERAVKEHPLQWFNYYDFWQQGRT